MESSNNTTHQENFRLSFGWIDASAIIPLPILGYFPSLMPTSLYVAVGWWVLTALLAFYDRSMLDIIKAVWHRRTKTCHARLKNNR
ncbi:hypothetical protein [Vibrio nigripulchritudo]|uniref:hypothetical protein n=1 Tax=Vibrio nigripulchritudo TaxID=28173 RepID=UPI00056F4C28|nr:hypothetical protein [Vibrio nigripulchritudo]